MDAHIEAAVKTWPFLDPEVEAAVSRVSKVHRHLEQNMSEKLSEIGLNKGAYKVLIRLVTSGAPYQLSPSRLGEMLVMSSGAMTNRLDSLEDAGLIERTPDPADRRGVLVRITEHGRTVLDDAMAVMAEREVGMMSVLGPDELHTLNNLLRKVLIGIEGPLRPHEGS
jgi:DNA-binding MarR family transcriptional regulator